MSAATKALKAAEKHPHHEHCGRCRTRIALPAQA